MKLVKFGDMLTAEAGLIVHGCNAQGVMGSGVALAVKNKYPGAFHDYQAVVLETPHEERLGKIIVHEVKWNLYIINAITQDNFGRTEGTRYVNYKAVHKCFTQIAELSRSSNLQVHYPLIGAGLGGGDWAVISDIIDSAFENYQDVTRTLWLLE